VARLPSWFSVNIGIPAGSAAGYWNCRWILDRRGDSPSIFGWLLRTAALGRNVSMLPHGGIETDIMDSALSHRRYLRGNDLFGVTYNGSSWP